MKNLRNHRSFEKESEREFVNISNLGINESVFGCSNVVEKCMVLKNFHQHAAPRAPRITVRDVGEYV